MGLRDWVSEKGRRQQPGCAGAPGLQWGSETGSRRRCKRRTIASAIASGFNGAPRLGLGEGAIQDPSAVPLLPASMGLRDWVSEKDCRAAELSRRTVLQWGSETGSRRRKEKDAPSSYPCARFNGAPRLGLGEGALTGSSCRPCASLQWGSETGSRRRLARLVDRLGLGGRFNGAPRLGLGEGGQDRISGGARGDASMGLRDWVSEKELQGLFYAVPNPASMGLRDWVSEKGGTASGRSRPSASFNGAPRLGLGEGLWVTIRWMLVRRLQWGSETGSRRRFRNK